MSFENINNLIAEKNAKLDELKSLYHEGLKVLAKDLFKEFFALNPSIEAILWHQYTPYFNDGETCTFDVHQPVFITKNFDPDDISSPCAYEGEEEYGSFTADLIDYRKYATQEGHKEYWEKRVIEMEASIEGIESIDWDSVSAMNDFIQKNDDIMEEMFGDHSVVAVTRDQIIVEEYTSHD